jgi:hypothetical protein
MVRVSIFRSLVSMESISSQKHGKNLSKLAISDLRVREDGGEGGDRRYRS